MENSHHNYSTLTWLNPELFTINGAPLKFYLEGYTLTEFHEISRIIKAHGGQLSELNAPDALVFCDVDHPVGSQQDNYYDIRYIRDSIVAREPQELINYKLHNHCIMTSVTKHESSHREIKQEIINEFHESMDYEHQWSNQHSRRDVVKSTVKNNYIIKDSIDLCSSDSEDLVEPTNRRKSETMGYPCVTTNFSDVDRMMESEKSSPSTSFKINDQNDNNYGENDQNHSEDDTDSDDSNLSGGIDRSQNLSSEEDRVKKRSNTLPSFTEEENEKIIKWMIRKNVMPRDKSILIWKEFLDEKILPNRNVTVWALAFNWRTKLKMHPTFVKYLQDAKDSGRVLVSGTAKRFTEQENRVILKYIIDNDLIDCPKGDKFWAKCLETCKLSLKPFRTVVGLHNNFRRTLRFNLQRFIDDPDVIERLKGPVNYQPRKNPKPHNFVRIDLD